MIKVPKTILIVCSDATSLKNFRGKLIEKIRSKGHRVIALAPNFPQQILEWCAELGVQTDETKIDNQSLNPVRDLISLVHLFGKMLKFRPAVVMGYTHKPALYCAFAAWLARVPHITMMVTGMGFGFEPGAGRIRALIPLITHKLFRIACAACDMVIFHNGDNQSYFLKTGMLGKRDRSCVVGGSGVDLAHYTPLPLPEAGSNQITFLMVARIVRYKGVLEYAKAAKHLASRFPQTRFLLAGYWDSNPLSYAEGEWEFIRQNLDYVGKCDDVRQLFAQAHVYVLPSYGEGMPRTVLEAMAAGRPVITCDTYGCRDTVVNGVNGFLVPVANWELLSDAMSKFLLTPQSVADMGHASLNIVREKFDVEKVNRDMIAALDLN